MDLIPSKGTSMRHSTYILVIFSLLLIGAGGAFYFLRMPDDTRSLPASLVLVPEDPSASLEGVNVKTLVAHPDELRAWLRKVGPKRIMEHLLENSGGGALEGCHQAAHVVGKLSYELYGATAFAGGSEHCHSGYYHGAMETMLYQEGTADLAGTVRRICDTFVTSFGKYECLHGVGHGIMAYEDYDLPKALDDCEHLGSDDDRDSCYGGVFMENIATAQGMGASPDHTTTWVGEDPHYPCNAISKDLSVQRHCYLMQTTWMLGLLGNDFSKVADECLKAPAEVGGFCFASMGRDAAGIALRDPGQINGVCLNAPKGDYYDYCIAGGLNVIVDFWGSNLGDQATALCRRIGKDSKLSCYTILAGRLKDIFTEQSSTARVCASFEDEYRLLCAPNSQE
jgi:hypothetical protein